MKPIINTQRRIGALVFLFALGWAFSALASDTLFSVVPAGDATYMKLGQLEKAGLLNPGDSQGPLTRFEVAHLINKAQGNMYGIEVAQLDEIPPPPDSGAPAPPSSSPAPAAAPANAAPAPVAAAGDDSSIPPPPDSGTAASPAAAQPAPAPAPAAPAPSDATLLPPPDMGAAPAIPSLPDTGTAPPPPPAPDTTAPAVAAPAAPAPAEATAVPTPSATPEDPMKWAKLAETLNSLEDAYQYELKDIKAPVNDLNDKTQALENGQYDLLKRLKGIDEYPTITWHGIGRVFGAAQRFTSSDPGYTPPQNDNFQGRGYIDFEPVGVIGKQIRWELIVRYGTAMVANDSQAIDSFLPRRGTMELKTPWFSATFGDFDESYTPLTLWNRNNLDLRWVPEMMAREDDTLKYESFMNNEPNWPFRGLRLGTEIAWPDSTWFDHFNLSLMGDILRNGYNDLSSGGNYFGPGFFTDYLFAGKTQLATKRLFLGGNSSLKFSFDAYGLLLWEPISSQMPGSPYTPYGPTNWAHQYQIFSLKPSFEVSMGDGVVLGGSWESAGSLYEDDSQNSTSNVTDWAFIAGPYLKLDHSILSFNYLNIGPNFFSPLAQTRQDGVTTALSFNPASGLPTPELFSAPLRSQFFLAGVPRANDIFSFYDRTEDNTFPYGLATPNRQGGGMELDIKTLEKDAFKINGSVYFVQEIGGNLVSSSGVNGFVAVDAPVTATIPVRNFTYVNIGPSINLGPFIDDPEDLVIGTNVRFEQTNSSIGTLTSVWALGGVEAGLFSWWHTALSFGVDNVSGSEAGYNGTTMARYSYLFNNQDLGLYQPFTINGTNNSLRLSTAFTLNRNSKLYLDYDYTFGNAVPYFGTTPNGGNLNNQFAELTYEILF